MTTDRYFRVTRYGLENYAYGTHEEAERYEAKLNDDLSDDEADFYRLTEMSDEEVEEERSQIDADSIMLCDVLSGRCAPASASAE